MHAADCHCIVVVLQRRTPGSSMASTTEATPRQGSEAAGGTVSAEPLPDAAADGSVCIESVQPARYSSIAELSMKFRHGVNVVAKVLRVISLLEHTGMDGEYYRDIDVYIGDSTACIRLQGSGVHVDALQAVGSAVVVRNATVDVVKDSRQRGPRRAEDPILLRLKQFSKVSKVRSVTCRNAMPI